MTPANVVARAVRQVPPDYFTDGTQRAYLQERLPAPRRLLLRPHRQGEDGPLRRLRAATSTATTTTTSSTSVPPPVHPAEVPLLGRRPAAQRPADDQVGPRYLSAGGPAGARRERQRAQARGLPDQQQHEAARSPTSSAPVSASSSGWWAFPRPTPARGRATGTRTSGTTSPAASTRLPTSPRYSCSHASKSGLVRRAPPLGQQAVHGLLAVGRDPRLHVRPRDGHRRRPLQPRLPHVADYPHHRAQQDERHRIVPLGHRRPALGHEILDAPQLGTGTGFTIVDCDFFGPARQGRARRGIQERDVPVPELDLQLQKDFLIGRPRGSASPQRLQRHQPHEHRRLDRRIHPEDPGPNAELRHRPAV